MIKSKLLLLFSLLIFACSPVTKEIQFSSKKDIEAIQLVLIQSAVDWSKGDLKAYMNAYWKSDQLKFIGSRGVTYGWQQTLDNYKKGYPTSDQTGTLTFELLHIDFLAPNVYNVIGKYHLERSVGVANGIFTLIVKKIDGQWKIIVDHSE